MTSASPDQQPSFEELLQSVRDAVTSLESGDLSLDAAIATYGDGIKSITEARALIERAELRIRELSPEDAL